MHDGSSAVISATAYARIYEEQQPRLVAYARSLTRNAWLAEDLVAEAHFRVWRRLAEGHGIDNVSAYLTTTVRHLAYAANGAARETPRDPHADEQAESGHHGDDPAEQVSAVDLLVRVLAQLPERWVKALWLAEAEGQPLAQIGPQLGTKEGATAVLLHRAREGMRQAFLRTQTGAPDDPACQVHWSRMPAYVRGAATERQSDRLLGHVDTCADCRTRLAALMSANDRLPALVGPALLVFAVGGTAGKFLLTLTAAGAAAGGHAGGGASGLLHGVRQATGVGGTKAPLAVAAGAMAAGAAALVLILGPGQSPSVPAQRTPVADAPVTQAPVAEQPVVPQDEPAIRPTTAPGQGEGEPVRQQNADDGGTAAAVVSPSEPATQPPASNGSDGGSTADPGGNTPGGDGNGDGDGSGTPPVTTEPTPPAAPTDPEPTPPAPPTEPTQPTDPAPPADPVYPTPVDPPPVTDPAPAPADPDPVTPPDDDCPPQHGHGNGNGNGNGKDRTHGHSSRTASDASDPEA
ncbi:sigma-70 family RNA polymerase sigma factor [Streptomyces sp. GbtcB6]|uniref:sigma-70 family RNA polymerase sigma factor n=1 Tax=Streptomyces sp. GbtcB6 TaxID=2824751 RepID=UPI001C30D1BA|nr:sigma-70 family RNA polymerase sigma factor [Streptomyces sp. GbtcB6]